MTMIGNDVHDHHARWFVGSISSQCDQHRKPWDVFFRWIAFDPVLQTCLAPVERFLKLGYPKSSKNIYSILKPIETD